MKAYLISGILSASLTFGAPLLGPQTAPTGAGAENPPGMEEQLPIIDGTSLFSKGTSAQPDTKITRIMVITTAYSSTPDQTDDTPFITASGTQVRDGLVAANFLPLGTQIRIPEFYGDKVFTVEDRMHFRKGYQVDIWFPNKTEALDFGAKITTIEVLEG
ncbi:MAG: 3D domain-containing protein [Parcubacteria group bacterium]|nr:3D domain-containing protein [Parcubacteria group bacterium]